MRRLMMAAAAVLMLTACKQTEYVTVERVRTDTTFITKHQRDSVWMHDSVWVERRGDTLTVDRWHTRYVERTTHDTLYRAKTDSVPVPYPVTQYVDRQLTWWQRTQMYAGDALLLALLAAAVWFAVKKFVR